MRVSQHIRELAVGEQRIVDHVVERFLETGHSVTGREIRMALRSKSESNAFVEGLVPDLLRRDGSPPHETYQPTILGYIHTQWASDFSSSAERMLGFFRGRASDAPNFQHYTWGEVKKATEWKDENLPLIRAVILACGYANGGTYGDDSFRFATPVDIEELLSLKDFGELLTYRLKVEQADLEQGGIKEDRAEERLGAGQNDGSRKSPVSNVTSASPTLLREFRGANGAIGRIAWSPSGELLAAPCQDGGIYIWNAESDEPPLVLVGHEKRAIAVSWSPDEKYIASGSDDGTARIWTRAGPIKKVLRHPAGVGSVAWSPDGGILATGSNDGRVRLFDTTTFEELRATGDGSGGVVAEIAWSPSSAEFAVVLLRKTVVLVYDRFAKGVRQLNGHESTVGSVAWSAANMLASGSHDGAIGIWAPDSGSWLRGFLRGHEGSARSVAFSSDGALVASKSDDGTVRVWSIADEHQLAEIPEPDPHFEIVGVAFQPNSTRLATLGEGDTIVRVWDLDGVEKPKPVPTTTTEEHIQLAIRALSDGAVDDVKDDLLGRAVCAEALVDFLLDKDAQTPITLAIDAPWGQGKTSLMHMMRGLLTEHGYVTVMFNAWFYDKAEQIGAALAEAVLSEVRALPIRDWIPIRSSIFKMRVKWIPVCLWTLLVIPIALVILWQPDWLPTWAGKIPKEYASLGALGILVFWFTRLWKATTGAIGAFSLRLRRFVRTPKYEDRLPFLDEFRRDFTKIIQAVVRRQKAMVQRAGGLVGEAEQRWDTGRFVVFVDDLDRCSPGSVVDVIEAINLILGVENCVFVLGMDMEMVRASIETRYKDLESRLVDRDGQAWTRFGQRFLEKIVQVHFRIPAPTPDSINRFQAEGTLLGSNDAMPTVTSDEKTKKTSKEERYAIQVEAKEILQRAQDEAGAVVGKLRTAIEKVRSDMGDVKPRAFQLALRNLTAHHYTEDNQVVRAAVAAVVAAVEFNPRKIKRFVNLFRLHAKLVEAADGFAEGVTPEVLARWVYLGMDWPELGVASRRNPTLLPKLVASSSGGTGIPADFASDPRVARQIPVWQGDAALERFLAEWAEGIEPSTVEQLRKF